MRALWTAVAICMAGAVAAQEGSPTPIAILDFRGITPEREILTAGGDTGDGRATLVFPGAGETDMVILPGIPLDSSGAPDLTARQREDVVGRIGVSLPHDGARAPALHISRSDTVAVDLDGDQLTETISVCLSETQVHITARKDGRAEPLWARAFSLGYDVSPTCPD